MADKHTLNVLCLDELVHYQCGTTSLQPLINHTLGYAFIFRLFSYAVFRFTFPKPKAHWKEEKLESYSNYFQNKTAL